MSSGKYRLNTVNVRLVKESTILSDYPIVSSESAVKLAAEEFKTYDREVVAVINLNTKLKPVNMNICSMGTLDSSFVNPREVMKSSILSNAKAFIMMHNHPSGDLTPSQDDISTTKRLAQCGHLLGIEMLDSIIIAGQTGEHISLKEQGLMPIGSELCFDFEESLTSYGKMKEIEKEADTVGDTKRVYLSVHNVFVNTNIPNQNREGTYNMVTLPKNVVAGDKDLSGGRIYPLDQYIYPCKFNPNLTTVQFTENQTVRVNLNGGEVAFVNAKDLTKAVDLANKQYLEENKEKMAEAEMAEKGLSQHKQISRIKEKGDDIEI